MARCKRMLIAMTALFGVLGALSVGVVAVGANQWYFSEREVSRVPSPRGTFSAIVTKRMCGVVGPVEARLKIEQPDGWNRVWLDVFLYEYDCWEDVRPETYPVEWISDKELHVGRKNGSDVTLRCRDVGYFWVAEKVTPNGELVRTHN